MVGSNCNLTVTLIYQLIMNRMTREPVEINDIHVDDVAYCAGSSLPLEYNRIGKLSYMLFELTIIVIISYHHYDYHCHCHQALLL